jgi:hypothetical protein
MKKITELTEKEGKEIFEFVYPPMDEKFEHYSYQNLKFEPTINKDGSQQITFGFRPIIGIMGHNGQDRTILHFDNTKVVLWLYKNGYDISDLLKINSGFSDMEDELFSMKSAIYSLNRKREYIPEDKKHLFTLEYVLKELERIEAKYIKE